MEELELVKKCQDGDLQAFETLVERYGDMAVRTAYLVTGRRDMAEDMAQEAFIQCFYSIKQFKHRSSFQTWFYRILVRVSRRMASKAGGPQPLEYLENIPGKEDLPDGYDFTKAWEDHQATTAVYQAVNRLDHPFKTAIVLHYFNGFSIKDIAQVLSCREGTVKSRLFTARRLLAEELRHQGWDVGDEKPTPKEDNVYAVRS